MKGRNNILRNLKKKIILDKRKNIQRKILAQKERKLAHVGCAMKKDIMQMSVLRKRILKKKP